MCSLNLRFPNSKKYKNPTSNTAVNYYTRRVLKKILPSEKIACFLLPYLYLICLILVEK